MNESDLKIYGHKPCETTQSLFYDMLVSAKSEIGLLIKLSSDGD